MYGRESSIILFAIAFFILMFSHIPLKLVHYSLGSDTAPLGLVGPMTKERSFRQEFTAQREGFSSFAVWFATYIRTNNSRLRVRITAVEENKPIFDVIISAIPLLDNAPKEFCFKSQHYSKGKKYILDVSSIDADQNNAITMWQQSRSDQENILLCNGSDYGNNQLVMTLGYSKYSLPFHLSLILFISLCICALICATYNVDYRIVQFGKYISESKYTCGYFFVSFLLTFLIAFLRLPSLTWQAEPWAETVTRYTNDVVFGGFFYNLTTLDFFYLPFFQSVISSIIVSSIGVSAHLIFILQMAALGFIALFSSIINLRIFRFLIQSDFIRFLVSLTICIGSFADYELFTYVNFPYFFCSTWILSLLVLNHPQARNYKYSYWLLWGLLLLTAISKSQFVIFIPPVLLSACYSLWRRKATTSVMFILLFLELGIQVAVSIDSSYSNPSISANLYSSTIALSSAFLWCCKAILHLLNINCDLSLAGTIGITVLICLTLLWMFRNEDPWKSLLGLLCCFVALANAFLTGKGYSSSNTPPFSRGFYFTYASLFLFFITAVNTIHIKFLKILPYFASIILFVLVMQTYSVFDPLSDENSDSNWKSLHTLSQQDSFFIPINPKGWSWSKNSTRIVSEQKLQANVIYDIDQTFPELGNNKLLAIYIKREYKPHILNDFTIPRLDFFDINDEDIHNSSVLKTEPNKRNIYFLINPDIDNLSKFRFTDLSNQNAGEIYASIVINTSKQ